MHYSRTLESAEQAKYTLVQSEQYVAGSTYNLSRMICNVGVKQLSPAVDEICIDNAHTFGMPVDFVRGFNEVDSDATKLTAGRKILRPAGGNYISKLLRPMHQGSEDWNQEFVEAK